MQKTLCWIGQSKDAGKDQDNVKLHNLESIKHYQRITSSFFP